MTLSKKYPAVIVGISGYSGLELARILIQHPFVELLAGFVSQGEFKLSAYLPESRARCVPVHPIKDLEKYIKAGTVVFLAVPAEISIELVPRLVLLDVDIIDLSGAFRLDRLAAQKWYGISEQLFSLFDNRQYGLVPWIDLDSRGDLPDKRLIANPGCYATAVLMAILPLLKYQNIIPHTLVIDAKSGASGAGKKPVPHLLFNEIEGECLPYRIGEHQHFPEICEYSLCFANAKIDPFFTTHLINVRRGIIVAMYANTRDLQKSEDIYCSYQKAYSNYSLVQFGDLAGSDEGNLRLKRVVGSARTEIRYLLKNNQLYVFSLIDNLMKGAASQAVENFNRLKQLPYAEGLLQFEGVL